MSSTKLAAQAPNTWTEKNEIGHNITDGSHMSERHRAVAVVLNSKVYIGTGTGEGSTNPVTFQWAKKASLTGTRRSNAVAFAINNIAYDAAAFGLGTKDISSGASPPWESLMWEYDPTANTWTSNGTTLCEGQTTTLSMHINFHFTHI